MLVPDIVFIAQDRLHIIGPKTIDTAPDLVVEVLSPGTRRDLETKRALYARFGVREYWTVDPDAGTVTLLALTGDTYEPLPAGEGGAIASRLFPGLNLVPAEVFQGSEP